MAKDDARRSMIEREYLHQKAKSGAGKEETTDDGEDQKPVASCGLHGSATMVRDPYGNLKCYTCYPSTKRWLDEN